MKILLLEDNGFLGPSLKTLLEDIGHVVFTANKIAQAMDFIDDTFDLLIVDLHVNPVGLTEDEMDKSELFGWTWLKKYVLIENKWKNKIIIFSKYIPDLKRVTPSTELKDIILVQKNGKKEKSPFEELMNKVNGIAKK